MIRPVDEWFFDWLEYHQMLHPHRGWMRPENANALDFYAGWIECFEGVGASPELAQRVSRQLQQASPRFLNEHLPAIKAALLELKKATSFGVVSSDGERFNPELVRASVQSAECPECGGSGWARRRATWPGLRWTPVVDLFCRCPAGRWRRINDPDIAKGLGRNYDDLQAHPDLWDPALSFSLWSPRPTTCDVEIEPETAGAWRYLAPGDVAPGRGGDLAPLAGGIGKAATPERPEAPAF